MGLKGSDAQGGGGTGIKSPKGTFVRIYTIVSAEQFQDHKPHESFTDPMDIVIELKATSDGLTFEKNLSVIGNFKRDHQTRDICGWGSAFKVADLFAVLGVSMDDFELDENSRVSDADMKFIIGKELVALDYITDQGKTRAWDRFGSPDDAENFGEFFIDDHAKSGYPKNFDPEAKIIKKKKVTTPVEDGPFGAGSTDGIVV